MTVGVSRYPEHEKWKARLDDVVAADAFLDWLDGQGIVLARYDEGWDGFLPVHILRERLLSDYVGVDYDQWLVEEAHMYDALKAKGEEEGWWNPSAALAA